ncbi:methylated-DNA--[protein]-cysteine S-methyltransferase [Filifactor villosus]|uniref:Methylated-DNA--protein-cysteine methyltransferase n=1 Tax=Filifactor villosus TaxID=29374 RepID=A0ABV9QME8_9FIRM
MLYYQTFLISSLGEMTISCDGEYITSISFGKLDLEGTYRTCPLLEKARKELEEYAEGRRREFSLPLHAEGTDFQKKVWEELCKVGYAETVSYTQIAQRIGNPKAVRAVGMANNRNPISIVIPCHRVIGKDGKLVGYGGGLERKEFLLDLEKRNR